MGKTVGFHSIFAHNVCDLIVAPQILTYIYTPSIQEISGTIFRFEWKLNIPLTL